MGVGCCLVEKHQPQHDSHSPFHPTPQGNVFFENTNEPVRCYDPIAGGLDTSSWVTVFRQAFLRKGHLPAFLREGRLPATAAPKAAYASTMMEGCPSPAPVQVACSRGCQRGCDCGQLRRP